LKDCGGDAHPHVAQCPQKESRADTYFGTKEQFVAAQNKSRRTRLLEFLRRYPQNERKKVEKNISKDLADLNIVLAMTEMDYEANVHPA
jgi:DNA anti-recombination protein RmuC